MALRLSSLVRLDLLDGARRVLPQVGERGRDGRRELLLLARLLRDVDLGRHAGRQGVTRQGRRATAR